jgi:hypothetical protein
MVFAPDSFQNTIAGYWLVTVTQILPLLSAFLAALDDICPCEPEVQVSYPDFNQQ